MNLDTNKTLKNEIREELKIFKQSLLENNNDFVILEELLLLIKADAEC
jgi:hypothetical protein